MAGYFFFRCVSKPGRASNHVYNDECTFPLFDIESTFELAFHDICR